MPKARKHPLTQGDLKIIHDKFFAPTLVMKPETMTINEWYEMLFDTKYRNITRYICFRPFKMPGLYLEQPNVKIQGIGYRNVTMESILWVRESERPSEPITVEWLGGQGQKDQCFELTPSEWGLIKLNLHPTGGVRK